MSQPAATGPDFFALVTYTPEPLREWLLQLRRSLPVESSSEPHITILPPRPLMLPAPEAWQKITSILNGWAPFEVELSEVQVFPETNVLYLQVSDGYTILEDMHSTLNTGDFFHEETFSFHPHLTVGGPVPVQDLQQIHRKAIQAWEASGCPCRFKVEEFAFVCISTSEHGREWNRLWMHKLPGAKVQQRAAGTHTTNQTF